VGLESEPSPDAKILSGVGRVTREVTIEVSRNTTKEKIRIAFRDGRVVKESKGNTVGSVASLESANVVLPVLVARIVALEECALLEKRELRRSLANDTDLVSVLHITTDTRKILDDLDSVGVKFLSGANTRKLQDLRCVESTARDNDFTASMDGASNTAIISAGTRISTVQALSKEIVNTSCLRLGVRGVEVDLGDQGVEGNVELILLGTILVGRSSHLEDKVARRAAHIVSVHRQRDLIDKLVIVARLAGVVNVESQNLSI
jgi:hypothetical protein